MLTDGRNRCIVFEHETAWRRPQQRGIRIYGNKGVIAGELVRQIDPLAES